jgi:uncharacterized protein YxeA
MLILILILILILLLIFLIIFLTYVPSLSQKNKFISRSSSYPSADPSADPSAANISFFSKKDTSNFLLLDPDNYILNMSKIDLKARGVSSGTNEYYKQLSASLAADFSQKEKQELLSLMNMVKNNFKNTIYAPILEHNIIFAKTDKGEQKGERSDPRGERSNPSYENGFPHTRYNLIFLSPLFFRQSWKNQLNTLEHECIHIFQRFYPIDTEKYLNSMGFQKKGDFKTLFPEQYRLKRSNSDIDNNIWTDPSGNFMFPIYSSEDPKSLNDVLSHDMEHPYEWMAYRN